MSEPNRLAAMGGGLARIAVAGLLAVGGCLGCSPIAIARPSIPADPLLPAPPPGPEPQNPSSAPLAGLDRFPDLSGNGTADLFGLLSQNPAPAAPGGALATPPAANPLNNGYLLEQNLVPAAPGRGTVIGVPPGQENADTSGADYIQRLYAGYQQGGLTGAGLGQRSLDQLGEPLPGTAPPPGTPLPPGLGQNLVDQPPIVAPIPPPPG
jgi:hypothetical protein